MIKTISDCKKQELRSKYLIARTSMTVAARKKASAQICDIVIQAGFFRKSRIVGCYLPTDKEVDTWPIIERALKMGKQIFAPVLGKNGTMRFHDLTTNSSLFINQFGLMEPQSSNYINPHHIDIVITPLVAFDSFGNRIGMGGGYYDRCFSFLNGRKTWLHPKLIGLAFDCQRVNLISPSPWDIGLYRVITETT